MAIFSFARRAPAASQGAASADLAIASACAYSSGPGWYDSSWDLHRGLTVREGLPPDAHLHEWLEQFVRCQAGARPS